MYNLLSTKLLLLLVVLYKALNMHLAASIIGCWFRRADWVLICDLRWGSWLQCSRQLERYLFRTVYHWIYFDHLQFLLSPAKEIWGKVIFSEACVENSVNGGGQSTWAGTPLPSGTPPQGRYPLAGTPPGPATPPWTRYSPEQCMLGDTGNKHPTGMHSCSMFIITLWFSYYNLLHYMAYQKETSYTYAIKLSSIVLQEKSWHKIKYYLRECCTTNNSVQFFFFKKLKNDRFDGS